jgi:hypothetical protein
MHFKPGEPILSFDQFWRLTGLKKTQVQNWTNGRPLKVRGTVADATGKGSRNLYTLRDAYFFVFLEELRKLDLSHNGLQRVLSAFETFTLHPLAGTPDFFDPINVWLVVGITSEISVTRVESSGKPGQIRLLPSALVNDFTDRGSRQFAVNIAKIREEVDARWEKLSRKKATQLHD